jgi:hypothetical protein
MTEAEMIAGYTVAAFLYGVVTGMLIVVIAGLVAKAAARWWV